MDLGLGNLATLKSTILAKSMQGDTDYDAFLTALGLGVARQFEKFCDRRFARVVGDQQEFTGDRLYYILPRYPIETITLAEVRYNLSEGYISQSLTDLFVEQNNAAGLVEFAWMQGVTWTTCRITWTGGYWYDTTEDNSGTIPGGATALPEDLKLAWLLYCQEVWNKRDKLGLAIAEAPDASVAIAMLKLPTGIKEMLNPFRRFMMS